MTRQRPATRASGLRPRSCSSLRPRASTRPSTRRAVVRRFPTVFFVGFAGYAEQRVFAEEIKLAARVVGERYGSEKRSIFLINDRRSLDAQPLASPTALRHALRSLARKMNTRRDVLFLALPRTVTSTR